MTSRSVGVHKHSTLASSQVHVHTIYSYTVSITGSVYYGWIRFSMISGETQSNSAKVTIKFLFLSRFTSCCILLYECAHVWIFVARNWPTSGQMNYHYCWSGIHGVPPFPVNTAVVGKGFTFHWELWSMHAWPRLTASQAGQMARG